MTASSPTLAARERSGLADLLESLGPQAPTCCAGWTTANLAAHLVVRERRPDALPGYGLEGIRAGRPLASWSHRLEDRLRESTAYPEVVRLFRSGPPSWSPMAWPGGQALNIAEFVIHHEDVRRVGPGWSVRDLPRSDQDQLWRPAQLFARGTARRGGVVLRRTDTGAEKRIGAGRATVEGEPLELLLWASGRRDVAQVTVR